MNSSFFKTWAVAATAIALVLLGVLIGQLIKKGPGPEPVTANVSATEKTESFDGKTSTDGESNIEPPIFVIPDAFTSVPSEWHTVLIENGFDGYAILFDPPRREVIIEKCRHPGYFNSNTGQPVQEGREFCSNVLWGKLLTMDEHSARVQARNGNQLDITLSLTRENGLTQLALTLPEHQMELVPGSKNDLFQAMDKSSVMTEQKRRRFEFLEARDQQLRQQQSKPADTDS